MLARLHVPVGWGELFKRTVKEAIADDVLSLAAQQAYYFFFALFPALLALISIASFFPIENLVGQVVDMMGRFAPPDVVEIVRGQMQKIADSNSGGVLTLAFLFTLWSSSSAILSLITTLNAAYDITEGRPWWKTRLVAIGLTMGMSVFILVSMALVIVGPTLAEHLAGRLGLGGAFEWTWKILQWPVVFLLVATAIALVYYFAPDAEQEFVWITPGSVLATVLWVVVSIGLKFYLAKAGDYNETYGTIGGVMVLLLWFYLSGLAILVGAELNAEIEHASPYGKAVGEKVPGEKKKIGVAAERDYEERRARGETVVPPFPDDVNCDVDREVAGTKGVRPSDVLIGTAALLPVALKLGKDIRQKLSAEPHKADDPRKDDAA